MNTTTTTPARVLTEEQRTELWKLFCEYGHLRSRDEHSAADQVQEEYSGLLWSLSLTVSGVA